MVRRRRVNGRPAKTSDRGTAIKVALIGSAATLLAAAVTGIFALFSGSDNGEPNTPEPGKPVILTVSFAQTRTEETVVVKGMAQNIPAHESVYVVAAPSMLVKIQTLDQWRRDPGLSAVQQPYMRMAFGPFKLMLLRRHLRRSQS